MHEFEVDGIYYRARKMDAFKQFHVARKITPVLSKLGPSVTNGKISAEGTDMFALVEPALETLAQMSEEDCNYVLQACLAVVERKHSEEKQEDRWMKVWHDGAKRLMFDDIGAPQMLQIAVAVIMDALQSFLGARPSNSTGQTPAPVA